MSNTDYFPDASLWSHERNLMADKLNKEIDDEIWSSLLEYKVNGDVVERVTPRKVTYKSGDVFTSQAEIIVHGVNCGGVFGAGFAKVVADRHPKARSLYLKKYRGEGWKLGDIQACYIPNIKIETLQKIISEEIWFDRKRYYPAFIVNAATQDTYGRNGVHVDYEAVRTCLEKTFELADSYGFNVAMPRIGCGLAGGDWDTVREIVEDAAAKYKTNVEVYTN